MKTSHLLAALVAAASILVCHPVAAQGRELIGDADGNGVFDLDDARYLETVLELGMPFEPQVGRLSDVAQPCDGRLDEDDLFRLERAGRFFSLGASRSKPVSSACHGALIGQAPPDRYAGVEDILTLDESFAVIADVVPEFAGFYIDRGVPTVAFTQEDEDLLEAAKEALAEVFGAERMAFEEEYRAVTVERSFAELHEYRKSIRELLREPEIVAIDTDERHNRLWLAIRDEADRPVVENLLTSYGVPEEAFALQPMQVETHDKFKERARPLRGGRQTDRISGGFCTMGPVIEILGTRGWLTNAHCTENVGIVEMDQMFQHVDDDLNNIAGIEQWEPFNGSGVDVGDCDGKPCRWSDSAFVDVARQATSSRGKVEEMFGQGTPLGHRFINSVVNHPFFGDDVCKSGRSTGFTCGDVTLTCLDIHVDEPAKGLDYYLQCQTHATYDSEGGDSGSPVFKGQGTTAATWFGLHWGGTFLGGLFSPVSGLIKDLGPIDAIEGNDPPDVLITSPMDGSSMGDGNVFTLNLEADFWDDENGNGCPQCEVYWKSDVDGSLGVSQVVNGKATLQVTVLGPGNRVITATAHDSSNNTNEDQITLFAGNAPPQVWIDFPTPVMELTRDTTYTFQGGSYDPESFGPLTCGALLWEANNVPIAIGCYPQISFSTTGGKLIKLTGFDPQNKTGVAYVYVTVVEPGVDEKPTVDIVLPKPNAALDQDGWAKFTIRGDDPDDASPLTLEWILSGPGLTPITLHTNATANDEEEKSISFVPSAYVYVPCGGRPVTLEATATDPTNKTGWTSINATVMRPPC